MQEVTPPVARTRRTRSEVSDDDEGDNDNNTNAIAAYQIAEGSCL